VRRVSSTLRITTLAGAILIAPTAASAQTTPATPDRGYVVGVAESAFGNVTSQSYGAEFGVTVRPDMQVFGSFGHVKNVTTSELSTAAQSIASALTQLQPNSVDFSVNEPATFFVGGVRYRFSVASTLKPYISGASGVGSVSKDVKFLIGGTDVTNSITQYVTLGSTLRKRVRADVHVRRRRRLAGVGAADRRHPLPDRPHRHGYADQRQPPRRRHRRQILDVSKRCATP
jgi:hypothetical protein